MGHRFCVAALLVALPILGACGDDTTVTLPTTPGAETTTSVAETSMPPATTTAPETTTTTLGTGTLIDTFDGSTLAVPGVAAPDMGFDLSTTGFLVVSNAAHPSPGTTISYYATYPHLFRDGSVTMRFRPGAPSLGAKYALFLWAVADLTDFTEVQVEGDEITVTGWSAGRLVGAATLSFPEGTFDPAGFNELRVQAFDGNLEVFLNGIGLGAEFPDPAPLHEGILGFSLLAQRPGSEMTLDEFRVEPEVP